MPDTEGKKPEEQVAEGSVCEEQSRASGSSVKKKGKHGVISSFIMVICIAVFAFAAYNIIKQQVEDLNTDKTVGELKNTRLDYEDSIINDPVLPDNGNGGEGEDIPAGSEIPSDTAEPEKRTFRLVFDETGDDGIAFLQAPIDEMEARNPDTVGWLNFPDSTGKVGGLPIDLPIVYSGDNEYYLEHNFDGEKNINGWVFVDYRNGTEYLSENYNTILYGHARSNNMFGGLKYLNTEKKWYNDKQNHYIYIKTHNEDTVWQIFAWYETSVVEETSSVYNYIRTDFSKADTFVQFCNVLQDKNEIGAFSKFEFSGDDRILTLSTCKSYDKDVRVVVHAKLVKLGIWE